MKLKLQKTNSSSGGVLIPLLFVVITFSILLVSGTIVNKSQPDTSERYVEDPEASGSQNKKNLQLKDLAFKAKPTIIPSSSCNHDNGQPVVNTGQQYDPTDPAACKCNEFVIECKAKKCIRYISLGGTPVPASSTGDPCGGMQSTFDLWCQDDQYLTKGGDGIYCLGKPVIYLYPEKPTLVNVKVKTQGEVVISDPQIETTNGWNNVLAHPNGILLYKGNAYRELFYETESQKLKAPKNGYVFETKKLNDKLLDFITKLGLTRADEQDEFLDWWIPRLEALNSPYILVSVLDKEEKHRLDTVEIQPKPDTFIEFIAYFRPLSAPIEIEPLNLPKTPERKGFTAVEWGGVIGY